MKKNISHPKTCAACKKTITRANIQYDYNTLKGYCSRPAECKTELRPKSLTEGSKGLTILLDQSPYSNAITKQLEEMIPKSHAFRSTPEQALYLIKYAHKHNLYNINQIMQHLLDTHIALVPLEDVPARNPIVKSANSGFQSHSQNLKDEVEYYKKLAHVPEEPKYIKPPSPLEEQKKNIAFRL